MDQALKAHQALSCSGYSRTDFIVSDNGAGLSRNQYPAGPDQGLALPEGAQGPGHRIRRFPARPDRAGGQRTGLKQRSGQTPGKGLGTGPVERLKFARFRANTSQGGSNRALPAPILPFVYQEVRRLTLAAHVALGCRGVSCCGFPLRRPHRGNRASFSGGRHPARHDRDVICARTRKAFAGITFDELVQWMVQDASLDRCDRRGPKLT